jgi:signal transduction histidine kinase
MTRRLTESDLDLRLLVFAPVGRDAELTASLLTRAGLQATPCASMQQLCEEARRGAAGLVLTDEGLTPAGMALLTPLIAEQEPWSDLPILLFTGAGATVQARSPTLDLLAPLGNVTLLDRPVRPITMVSAAKAALRARKRQYAARAELMRQQEAVRKRDEFLALLGHELRNPLGSIGLGAELLARQSGNDQLGKRLKRQVRHLARLVDDLLDVSRVSSGKLVLKREILALDEVLRRVAEVSRPQAEAKGQQLTLSLQPARVEGDPVRLEQVFGNLLGNAVKYTQPGGHLQVRLEVAGDSAIVTVSDDGVGIAPEMLQEVFEPFVQARSTIDRAEGGLGIGLTLVKSLVELHDGAVVARSEGVGRGSAFQVTLPRAEGMVLEREPTLVPGPCRPLQVLIVEDNADSRELLRAVVGGLGHTVEVAEDGGLGLASAMEREPDVMLVDIGLPVLDGYSLARELRARGKRTHLIAITGYGQPEDKARALAAGFDVHCTKPVDPVHLQRLLQKVG